MRLELAAALLALAACAAPDVPAARAAATDLANRALGPGLELADHDAAARAALEHEVASLLSAPLDADGAVRIALARHAGLRAELARLGLAASDLAHARTLANPELALGLRFERGFDGVGQPELALTRGLIDLLTRSDRIARSAADLARAQSEVADAVARQAFQTREAYFRALAAHELAGLAEGAAEAAALERDFMRRLHEAGNASERELALAEAETERARLELSHALEERAVAREALSRALGLWGEEAARWSLPARLAPLAEAPEPSGDLERYALEHRLDLAAARSRVESAARALGLERRWRLLPELDVGLDAEREDGTWSVAPQVALELPLFDRGQVEVARARAELEVAEQELAALAVEIRSEVRAALERRRHAVARLAHVELKVLPAEQRALAATRREFDYMLAGVFELLRAKRAELDAERSAVEARRDAWIADGELARALGAPLPQAEPAPRQPATESELDHHHPPHHQPGD